MHDMNENSLLQEIEADLTRQQYEKLWKKYGPYVLGAAFLIIAATAGGTGYKSYKIQEAQKTTAAYTALFAQKSDKPEELAASLEKFSTENSGTIQSVFARLKSGAVAVKANKIEDATRIYEALASDKGVDMVHRQLADLLYVQTLLDTGEAAALEARLLPLMKDDSAWRFTAKEFAGYLALRVGDKEKAKVIFTELKTASGAPSSIVARSGDIVSWLNGGV